MYRKQGWRFRPALCLVDPACKRAQWTCGFTRVHAEQVAQSLWIEGDMDEPADEAVGYPLVEPRIAPDHAIDPELSVLHHRLGGDATEALRKVGRLDTCVHTFA